mmetsp:Transcript_17678/g.37543  ORF Transcript_17678/g.37543 Transcript_17678/m.37543 type:complete len:352 (-) Transcript_17678:806-1861(-)
MALEGGGGVLAAFSGYKRTRHMLRPLRADGVEVDPILAARVDGAQPGGDVLGAGEAMPRGADDVDCRAADVGEGQHALRAARPPQQRRVDEQLDELRRALVFGREAREGEEVQLVGACALRPQLERAPEVVAQRAVGPAHVEVDDDGAAALAVEDEVHPPLAREAEVPADGAAGGGHLRLQRRRRGARHHIAAVLRADHQLVGDGDHVLAQHVDGGRGAAARADHLLDDVRLDRAVALRAVLRLGVEDESVAPQPRLGLEHHARPRVAEKRVGAAELRRGGAEEAGGRADAAELEVRGGGGGAERGGGGGVVEGGVERRVEPSFRLGEGADDGVGVEVADGAEAEPCDLHA